MLNAERLKGQRQRGSHIMCKIARYASDVEPVAQRGPLESLTMPPSQSGNNGAAGLAGRLGAMSVGGTTKSDSTATDTAVEH